jgi:hypothetical protein
MARMISGADSLLSSGIKPVWSLRGTTLSSANYTGGVELSSFWSDSHSTSFIQGLTLSSGRITAPVSGLYHMTCTIRYDGFGGSYFYVDFRKNQSSSSVFGRSLTSLTSSYLNTSIAGTVPLRAGDTISVYGIAVGDTTVGLDGDSYWTGSLVSLF